VTSEPTALEAYADVAGREVIEQVRQLASRIRDLRVVHVNSTREGGGVAEILHRLVPLMQQLGLAASWEIVMGEESYYRTTKAFHNGLQGTPVQLDEMGLRRFEATVADNADRLRDVLEGADVVFIHDPQPAPLLKLCPNRRGKWIWRCHIDVSHPYRPVWKYLRNIVAGYDASVFSLPAFAQPLPHPEYIVPPSIDPLSQKNMSLSEEEVAETCTRFGIDRERPLLVQVSRFDRFKDPVGVIAAYRQVRSFSPVQLVLAGGSATDDPEGEAILREVRQAAGDDADIHILDLPADAHRTINALQRAADIVVQKSTREGFGLTVTEAMWKGKPVIGGDTGGIRLQVIDHHTGFLVSTPEGAALRIRYLLHHRDKLQRMGEKARQFARESFLLTRQLREYLTIMVALTHDAGERIEIRQT